MTCMYSTYVFSIKIFYIRVYVHTYVGKSDVGFNRRLSVRISSINVLVVLYTQNESHEWL